MGPSGFLAISEHFILCECLFPQVSVILYPSIFFIFLAQQRTQNILTYLYADGLIHLDASLACIQTIFKICHPRK